MPFVETPFTSTILPIPVTRLGAHPNVVMAVLAGRAGPITVEHAGVSVTGEVLLVRPGVVHSVRLPARCRCRLPQRTDISVSCPAGRRAERQSGTAGAPIDWWRPLRDGGIAPKARVRDQPASGEGGGDRTGDAGRSDAAGVADELVRCLGMERTRALRCFKAATGLTFRRFKLWSALQHAALRMAERELVRTAAMDAGFADTAHLSRVFSSMFGLCPSVAIAGLDDRERE